MWKYYKYADGSSGDVRNRKAHALFRVDGVSVERYAGLERWVVPPFSGQVVMDINGMGGGWADVFEVTPEEAEEIKRELFDEDGNYFRTWNRS